MLTPKGKRKHSILNNDSVNPNKNKETHEQKTGSALRSINTGRGELNASLNFSNSLPM